MTAPTEAHPAKDATIAIHLSRISRLIGAKKANLPLGLPSIEIRGEDENSPPDLDPPNERILNDSAEMSPGETRQACCIRNSEECLGRCVCVVHVHANPPRLRGEDLHSRRQTAAQPIS